MARQARVTVVVVDERKRRSAVSQSMDGASRLVGRGSRAMVDARPPTKIENRRGRVWVGASPASRYVPRWEPSRGRWANQRRG
jgi:hypothetical protein